MAKFSRVSETSMTDTVHKEISYRLWLMTVNDEPPDATS